MKTPRKTSPATLISKFPCLCAGLFLALLAPNALAGNYYWDPEGAVAAPTAAQLTGTWSSSSVNWSASTSGGSLIAGPATATNYVFCSGSTAPGPFTVTVSGTVLVAGLFNGELTPPGFAVTLTGGTISLASGADGFVQGGSDGDGTVVSSTIAGTGQLVVEGDDPLTLNGVNTYTGGTEIGFAAGYPSYFVSVLNFNSGSSFGTGTITLTPFGNGSALVLEGTSAVTIPNAVTLSGNTTNNFVGNAAGLTFSGPWNLSSFQLGLETSSSATTVDTISGVISGTGGLTVSDAGTLILTGANTYSGNTILTSGTLDANNASSIPGNVIITGGLLDAHVAGAIGGNATITGGTLQLDSPAALPSYGTLNLPAASTNLMNLNFSGTGTILALNIGTNAMAVGTWGAAGSGASNTNSAFTGTGILNVQVASLASSYWDANGSDATAHGNTSGGGSGNWDNSTSDWWVSGSSDTTWPAGSTAYFAGTAGTVTVAANVASPDAIIFSSPGYTITNSGGSTLGLAAQATMVGIPAGTTTISAPIAGQGMVVNGPGTLVLSGASTYTASTVTTNGATLNINSLADTGTSALGYGPLTLGAGSTLLYNGPGSATSARTVTMQGATTATLNVPAGDIMSLNGQTREVGDTAAQGLTFTGGGTLNLGGTLDNSSLTMAINAGKVVITKTSASTAHGLGSGVTTVASGAELQLAGSGGNDLYSGCVLTFSSGSLFDANGQSDTFATLNLPGNGVSNGVLTNSSATTAALTSGVVLAGNTTINSTGPITLGGVISGNFAITQAGSGLLTLSGANTYNAGLTINPSTAVQINNATGAGGGPIAMGASSTLGVNIASGTLANPITGPSSAIVNIIETAADNLTISSSMIGFTGTMNCPTSPGTTAKAQVTSPTFSINPGATINLASGGTFYASGLGVVVPCALNIYGTGNSETYGALRLETGALVSGPVTLYGNTTMGNGTTGIGKPATISGVISGGYGITFTAEAGTIMLAGANTYTGVTALNGSVVQLDSPEIPGTSGPLGNSPASNPASIVMNGGLLQYSSVNNNDYSGRFTNTASQKFLIDVNGRTVTFASPLVSSGGSLTVTSSVPGGMLVLSGANTYSGPTTNINAVLQLASLDTPGVSGPLGSSILPGSIILPGGTLQYTAANGAHDYSSRFTNIASQAYNIDVNGQNVSFATALASSGGELTLSSTSPGGRLNLSGTNNYTGATTINTGSTLFIAGAGDLGNVLGTGNYNGAINDNGALNYASSASQTLLGAIIGTGSLVQNGTGTLTISNAANTYYGGTTVSNGTLYVNATGTIQGNVTVAGGVLELGNVAALNPAAIVTLPASPTGSVNLAFSGTLTVSALNFGTNSLPPGTYGANGNASVTYQNAAFIGSGVLNVVDQTAYWDPTPSANAYPGNGGTGSWDSSTSDWWVSGSSDSIWAGNNVATFAGSAGTVTLNASETASGLTFTTPGYNITGGNTLTLTGSEANSTPMVIIPSGTTTIGCPMATAFTTNPMIISGPGTLNLSANNDGLTNAVVVTGGATLSANTIEDLSSGQPSALGTGPSLTVDNGNLSFTGNSGQTARSVALEGNLTDTISVPSGDTLEIDGQVHVVSGTAPQELTFNGGGTLILGNSVDNSSLTLAVNGGTVEVNTASTSVIHGLGGGTSTVASGATLQLGGYGGFDLYSGCLLTVASGGVFDLNGQSDGMSTLTISGTGINGNGAIINNSGPSGLTNAGNGIVLTGNTTIGGNGSITLASTISGNATLTYASPGGATLSLNGANTFNGGVNIGPSCSVQLNAADGAGLGPIAIGASSTLILNSATTFGNTITGGSSSTIQVNLPAGNTLYSGSLSGFTGTVNIEQATTTGQLVINNANNEAHPVSASATWNIANGATLDLATPLTMDPASVIIGGSGNNQAFGSLRLDACNQQGNVLLAGGNCTIGDGNTTGPSTISGVISDNNNGYGFTKVGSVVSLVLTAVNTYSGPTIIQNGTLALGPTGSIANSSGIYITNGATFDVSQVSGGYALGASQILGNLSGAGTINGSLNLSSGAPLVLTNSSSSGALTVISGTLTLNNNPMTVNFPASLAPGTNGAYLLISAGSGGAVAGNVSSAPVTVTGLGGNLGPAGVVIISGSLYLEFTGPPVLASYSPLTYSNLYAYVGAPGPTYSMTAAGFQVAYSWYTNNVLVAGATGMSFTPVTTNLAAETLTVAVVATDSHGKATNTWIFNILATNNLPAYPAAVLASAPIGYWRLNEPDNGLNNGEQSVPCNDYLNGQSDGYYTGVNLGLTGYGSVSTPDTDTNETAVQFGSYTSPNSMATNINGINFSAPASSNVNFSVEAWVLPTYTGSQNSANAYVSQGEYNADDDIVMGFNSASPYNWRCYCRNAGGTVANLIATITPTPAWHHIVLVCNQSAAPGYLSMYIDGVSNNAVGFTGGLYTPANPVILFGGEASTTGPRQADVTLNDVAIYNYALTAAQVQNHYDAIGAPPVVMSPATNINISQGGTLSVTPVVSGTTPLHYYWVDGNTSLLISTNATLTVPNIQNSDTYYLTASNAFGMDQTYSAGANVVSGAPQIYANIAPVYAAIYAGGTDIVSLTAYGTLPLAYQWFNGATPILHATNSSYAAVAVAGVTNTFTCTVNNSFGPNTSSAGSATLVGVALPTDLYGMTILGNNPVAFWRLDEPEQGNGDDGVIAYDYVGQHNAYYNNAELGQSGDNPVENPDETSVLFGVFKNPNSYAAENAAGTNAVPNIDFSQYGSEGSTAEFSVEAWIQASGSQSTGAGIVSKGYNGDGEQFVLDLNANEPCFELRDSVESVRTAQSAVNVADGSWHHLVGVCDEGHGDAYLYVDGVLQATATGLQPGKSVIEPSASNPLDKLVNIGARSASASASTLADQFVGKIQDVALYNYALSSTNVAADYQAGLAIAPTISLIPVGSQVQITFTGTLLSATNVAGPYNPVTGANSPYTTPATNAQMFFRASN